MPNAERAEKLVTALKKAFGEDFTFTARKRQDDVDLPFVADTSRAAFTRTGSWFGGSKVRIPAARGRADNSAQSEVAAGPRADFAIADLPWMPIEGDLCLHLDDGETYSVARTLPNGFGRVVIYLTSRKR